MPGPPRGQRPSPRSDRLLRTFACARLSPAAGPPAQSRVAQLAEHATVNRRVPGSSPGAGALFCCGVSFRRTGAILRVSIDFMVGFLRRGCMSIRVASLVVSKADRVCCGGAAMRSAGWPHYGIWTGGSAAQDLAERGGGRDTDQAAGQAGSDALVLATAGEGARDRERYGRQDLAVVGPVAVACRDVRVLHRLGVGRQGLRRRRAVHEPPETPS